MLCKFPNFHENLSSRYNESDIESGFFCAEQRTVADSYEEESPPIRDENPSIMIVFNREYPAPV
jgi:hypothetical protein